jgi:hypothetical protein
MFRENFAVYIKGLKPRKSANVIRLDGHVFVGSEKIEFEAVLYSFDPQLDKNVYVALKEGASKILQELGLESPSAERLVQEIQQRLLNDDVIYEIER